MDKTAASKKSQKSRDDPNKGEPKKRKPSYLKDRQTSSGVTFRV